MSQTMVGPDGQEHEFPDGTPVPVMQAAVRKHGDTQAAAAQARAQGNSGVLGSIERNVGPGLKGFAEGLTSNPLAAFLHPVDTFNTLHDAGAEALQHPSQILPSILQGAADPNTFGRAMGGATQGVALAAAPSAISGLAEAASGARPVAALGRGMVKAAPYVPKVLGTDVSPMLEGLGEAMSKEPTLGRPPVAEPPFARPALRKPVIPTTPDPIPVAPSAPGSYDLGAQPEVQSLSGEKLPVAANRTAPPLVKGNSLEGHLSDSLKGLLDEAGSDPNSTFTDRRSGITKRYGDTTQGMSDADYERELAAPSRLGPDTTDAQIANAVGYMKSQEVPYQQGLPPSLMGLSSAASEGAPAVEAATPIPESWKPFAVDEGDQDAWVADRAAEADARASDNARRQAQRVGAR